MRSRKKIKWYEIIYKTKYGQTEESHSAIVCGRNMDRAVKHFRKISDSHKKADIVCVNKYNIEEDKEQ